MKKVHLFAFLACLVLFSCLDPNRNDGSSSDKELASQQDTDEFTSTVQLSDHVSLELIKVAHGSFKRGDGREITLTKDFWIGKYEVTQEQWKAVMGDQIKADNANQPAGTDTGRHPMENVTWDDAMAFCRKLNDMTSGQRPDGYDYSLPTEAQWEFAARGGTRSCGYEYSGSNKCREVAWYYENANFRTHEVGTKRGNELGIYDMSGNVWEWCRDWYERDYASDPEFLLGQATGADRVCRGGCWVSDARDCRAADRYGSTPDDSDDDLGFRLALVSVQR